MYAEERQQAMAELVAERGRLSVAALAEAYDVTTETVRRDLSALARLGLVRRVHGGAVPASSLQGPRVGPQPSATRPTPPRRTGSPAPRSTCSRPAGGTVMLDAGSTTSRLASLLPRDQRLTIFTHAVPVAARLAALAHHDLHLLPGRVRTTTQAAVGAETVEAMSRLRVDVAFLGTNALSVDHGLSTPNSDEAATKRAMVRSAPSGRRAGRREQDRHRVPGAFRRALARSTCWSPTPRIDPVDRKALEAAGVTVVIA